MDTAWCSLHNGGQGGEVERALMMVRTRKSGAAGIGYWCKACANARKREARAASKKPPPAKRPDKPTLLPPEARCLGYVIAMDKGEALVVTEAAEPQWYGKHPDVGDADIVRVRGAKVSVALSFCSPKDKAAVIRLLEKAWPHQCRLLGVGPVPAWYAPILTPREHDTDQEHDAEQEHDTEHSLNERQGTP